MDRRRFLAATAAGIGGALSGCVAGRFEAATAGDAPASTGPPRVDPEQLPVSDAQLVVGAVPDAIPAIVDPAFGSDWSGLEIEADTTVGVETIRPRLADDDLVVGIVRAGEARAYPLRVLSWHEAINDTFEGPLLITYCPLCRSAIATDRLVSGQPTTFGVSGLLWRGNLVLCDELTGSLWSQVTATAIQGPQTGAELAIRPSTLTSWAEWRDRHPETSVLLPPPLSTAIDGATRDYTVDPYEGYETSGRTGLRGPASNEENAGDYRELTGNHPKTLVLGIEHDGVARAYPLDAVQQAGVVNDRVGDLPVVVTTVDDELVGYVRRVGGSTLEFSDDGPGHLRANGSRWRRRDGTAVDGPHEGTRLDPATDVSPLYWFAWRSFADGTEAYGSDGGDA